eukprot:2473749-Prymnesium_polylepis.1
MPPRHLGHATLAAKIVHVAHPAAHQVIDREAHIDLTARRDTEAVTEYLGAREGPAPAALCLITNLDHAARPLRAR